MKRNQTKSKLTGKELIKAILEAQKDPEWVKEVRRFIKATTS